MSGCITTSGRELGEAGGGARRDHYLSAPGREAATFGRGGGAGGFELNYRTKTKKKDTNDTNIDGDIQQNMNNITGGNAGGDMFDSSICLRCFWPQQGVDGRFLCT